VWLLDAAEKALSGASVAPNALSIGWYPRSDREVRRQSSPEYPIWSSLDATSSAAVLALVDERWQSDEEVDGVWWPDLAFAMAAHPNGFVREPALRWACSTGIVPGALLALREMDGVPTIRAFARDEIRRAVQHFDVSTLLGALPVVQTVAFRHRNPEIAASVESAIAQHRASG
jgi:hypothetical protein